MHILAAPDSLHAQRLSQRRTEAVNSTWRRWAGRLTHATAGPPRGSCRLSRPAVYLPCYYGAPPGAGRAAAVRGARGCRRRRRQRRDVCRRAAALAVLSRRTAAGFKVGEAVKLECKDWKARARSLQVRFKSALRPNNVAPRSCSQTGAWGPGPVCKARARAPHAPVTHASLRLTRLRAGNGQAAWLRLRP